MMFASEQVRHEKTKNQTTFPLCTFLPQIEYPLGAVAKKGSHV